MIGFIRRPPLAFAGLIVIVILFAESYVHKASRLHKKVDTVERQNTSN